MEIVVPLPHTIQWNPVERVYINHLFLMNETIHQRLIGGAEGPPGCLYLEFRAARKEIQELKAAHQRPEALPWWYWILHVVAASLALNGIWQVLRWFEVLPHPHWFLV